MNSMTKWEYQGQDENTSIDDMNELGREGWELVSFSRNLDFKTAAFYIFKRPLPPEPMTEEEMRQVVINEMVGR
jgi:hypothetical protein